MSSDPFDGNDEVSEPSQSADISLPDIPDDATTDRPSEGPTQDLVSTPPDPEGDHSRWMAKTKLTFAVWVVMISFAVVVGLTLTQFITQKILDPALLNTAIDWAKGTTTIALGFVLGRAVEEAKRVPA